MLNKTQLVEFRQRLQEEQTELQSRMKTLNRRLARNESLQTEQ